MHLDGLGRHLLDEQLLHHGHMLGRTATAIEKDADVLQQRVLKDAHIDELGTWETGQLRQQFTFQNLADVTCCLMDGRDTLRMECCNHLVGQQRIG